MKKTLFILITVLFLAGCGSQNVERVQPSKTETETVAQKIKTYNNEALHISFDYPADWEAYEDEDEQKNVKVYVASPGNWISVHIATESFDEYELANKELIQEKELIVDRVHPTGNLNQPAREYRNRGVLYYLVEIKGNYVGISIEEYLTQKQKDDLDVILNSVSF